MKPQPSSENSGYKPCQHCGTPFSINIRPNSNFCCNGCAYVFELINREGYENYYQLRSGKTPPVQQAAFHPRDYQWLEKLIAPLENQSKQPEITLTLEGISCVGCVWLIEKLFQEFPGSHSIEINAQYGQIKIQWEAGLFPVIEFAQEIQRFGYLVGPPGKRNQSEYRGLLTRLGLCAAFALNTMLFTLPVYLGMEKDFILSEWFTLLTTLFSSLSFFIGGSYFIKRAWKGLRTKVLHIDLPIAIGVVGAYTGSLIGWLLKEEAFLYFDFVSVFIFLMLCGRWLQEHALESNRNRLLQKNAFKSTAHVLKPDASEGEEIPLSQIEKDQIIRILPGEACPVQSICQNRIASFSLEWINGESEMRTFNEGELIPAGSLNIGIDPVITKSIETWDESILKRLLCNTGQADRNPLLERVLKVYLIIVLIVATLAGLTWLLVLNNPLTAAQVVLSILVVSCPCALGVAVPLIQEWTIIKLRQFGVFAQKPSFIERLSGIKHLIFDKTGTLTLESPDLENAETLNQLSPCDKAVLKQLTLASLHPISRSLREALLNHPIELIPELNILKVQEEVGQGLYLEWNNTQWRLGRPTWSAPNHSANPSTQTIFSKNGTPIAEFQFNETIRDHAKETLSALKKKFSVTILSGDRSEKVRIMCESLELDIASGIAEQSPLQKETWIRQLPEGSTFFIGDGANDSLAFSAATIKATPATPHGLLQDKADFFFTGRDLSQILPIFTIAKIRKRAQRAVFIFAITYNFIAIILSIIGLMNPLLAAILMPLSSLITLAIVNLITRID